MPEHRGITPEFPKDIEQEYNPERISPQELLRRAKGRSIILGEIHHDRQAREATLALIQAAHQAGYRKLGVEVSNEGKTITLPNGKEVTLPGLNEELEFLRSFKGSLPETDPASYMPFNPKINGRPRMNRHWQIQEALRLGWEVTTNDPNHWNWMNNSVDGYLTSREPAMARSVTDNGPLISIFGAVHLKGLHDILSPNSAVYSVASLKKRETDRAPNDPEIYSHRGDFSRSLPLLVKE